MRGAVMKCQPRRPGAMLHPVGKQLPIDTCSTVTSLTISYKCVCVCVHRHGVSSWQISHGAWRWTILRTPDLESTGSAYTFLLHSVEKEGLFDSTQIGYLFPGHMARCSLKLGLIWKGSLPFPHSFLLPTSSFALPPGARQARSPPTLN